ncbi:MAG: efflux RND transporter permease subunit [Planctomycetaceae bacterium]
MNWLISTALHFRVLIVGLALALIVVGIQKSKDVPLDVFPEFAPPIVEIQTEAPGVSTEEVESLISVPIENAMNGIRSSIRSDQVGIGALLGEDDFQTGY